MEMMTNALTAPIPPALALARAAYRGDITELAQSTTLQTATQAIDEIESNLVPLNEIDRRFKSLNNADLEAALADSPHAHTIFNALKMIGRKIRPDFSADQATHWTAAMTLALSNLPPKIAELACQAALHETISFPADADKVIRDKAAALIEKQRLAIIRLRNLIKLINEANKPALPAPLPDQPLSQDERDRVNLWLKRNGLANRVFETGETRPLEPGETDPTPLQEAPTQARPQQATQARNYEPISPEEVQRRADEFTQHFAETDTTQTTNQGD